MTGTLIALLMQPMEQRLPEFRREPQKSYSFLLKTAFDQTKSIQLRWRAVTTMGRLDPVQFKPTLERALKSREWFMRNSALIAILNQPREFALMWSMKLVKDPSLMVRTQAVRNLVGLNAHEAEDLLWQQLWDKRNFHKNESLWVRAHMAEALARLSAGPGRARKFQRLIMDPDDRLHRWAVMGLEKSTGLKLSHGHEPIDVQRQKWLSRLGVEAI